MEPNNIPVVPQVPEVKSSKRGTILAVVVFVILIVLAGGAFFMLRQDKKQSEVVDQQVPSDSSIIELKDVTNDPRFAEDNFIKFIPVTDMDPCLDPYNGNLENCEAETFEKEIAPGIKAVVKLNADSGTKTPFLEFHDIKGKIQSIPEIKAWDSPSVAFVDKSSILVAFTCDECSMWYSYFNGTSWQDGYWHYDEQGLMDKFLPMKKMFFGAGSPPFEMSISKEFIKITEVGYCCDEVFWDVLNRTRSQAIGRYSFLVDRDTFKIVAGGFNNPPYPGREELPTIAPSMLSYLNIVFNGIDADPKDVIASWKNTIDFEEVAIPYPDNWTAEIFYSKERTVGIKFMSPDFKTTGRFISLSFPEHCRGCNPALEIDKSKGLDFDMIKIMHAMQARFREYLQEVSRKNVKIATWNMAYSRSWAFKTDFSFFVPISEDNVGWAIDSVQCQIKCLLISPWSEESFLSGINAVKANGNNGYAPFGIVLREIPKSDFKVTCTTEKCILTDTSAELINTEYPKNIVSSNEIFTKVGRPYVVATDEDGAIRYYFKMGNEYFLGATFRGVQELDPDFIKKFLDQVEIKENE